MSTKAKTLFLLNSTAGSLAASEPSGLTAEDIDGYEACCYHDMIEDDVTADIQTIDASPTDQLTSMLDVLVSSLSEAQLKKLETTLVHGIVTEEIDHISHKVHSNHMSAIQAAVHTNRESRISRQPSVVADHVSSHPLSTQGSQ